jgi:hypothetical protein
MKRFLSTMLLLSFLFYPQGRAASFAQEAAPQKAPTPSWQRLPEDVWKTDLGADRPEVVIFKLSNEEFAKFHRSKKAAKDYIDSHQFLNRKVNKVVYVDVVPAADGHGWLLVIIHSPHSTVGVLALQIP